MARRRLTLKRIDPWSVLKFGAIANVALLALFLLVMGVVWFIVDRLQVVEQVCGMATDVGFTQCGINAGNMFRALLLLGLLWLVIQTAILVFAAFLHNLIADLTGGLVVTVNDETPAGAGTSPPRAASGHATEAMPSSAARPRPTYDRAPAGTATSVSDPHARSQPAEDAPAGGGSRVEARGMDRMPTRSRSADRQASSTSVHRPTTTGDERLFGDR